MAVSEEWGRAFPEPTIGESAILGVCGPSLHTVDSNR